MELRHIRYFIAVAEALNFTKAAAQLRVAQPALSRQVQALEDEIGVDLLKRSSRGVTLTAEGKLFLDEARGLLKGVDDAVENVQRLARGQFGELHIGYSPTPTIEILPSALAAFQEAEPNVKISLHDLSSCEIGKGLRSGELHLAVTPWGSGNEDSQVEFETLKQYPYCIAMAPSHPLVKLKSVPLERLTQESIVTLDRKEYPDAYGIVERLFKPFGVKPKISAECDSGSSVITAIEAGRGITIGLPVVKLVAGNRLRYRPLAGSKEVISVGIAKAKSGDITPAGEKFCEILRKVAG